MIIQVYVLIGILDMVQYGAVLYFHLHTHLGSLHFSFHRNPRMPENVILIVNISPVYVIKTLCPINAVLGRCQWSPPSSGLVMHYDDVIMGAIASQITSLTIVYSTVYSGADQSKHQSSASLAFVWGIHRGPVNSPHKWPVTRKMFPFDDVIMAWVPVILLYGYFNM